ELSTLRQMMEVPNEPGLSPNNGLENALLSRVVSYSSVGVITLLYKGKGSRALLDSYRPITLLNSDYKLLTKALGYPLWACPPACG
ncbi:TPA: hypothetical protein ACH3X2_002285, partial [Trebouxia sp. C0005]